MIENLQLAESVVAQLLKRAVRKVIMCPGSFNSPFVAIFQQVDGLEIINHFEERSAAFFALGLSKNSGQATVICVTSGTAVAECLAATIEAHYSHTPLIVLSADREAKLSGSGYPQSIQQANLLSSHTYHSLDCSSAEDLLNLPKCFCGPVHINVRFKEPILLKDFDAGNFTLSNQLSEGIRLSEKSDWNATIAENQVSDFLIKHHTPLVIIGELPISFRPKVENFLARFKAPIIAEALSGLRESNILNDYILKTDSIIRDEPRFDCVLRIGAVPVSDLWRSLERVESFKNIDVCSVTLKSGLPGLSRESLCLDLAKQNFECPTEICDPQWLKEVVTKDLIQQKKIDQLISDLPFSEAAIMRALSNQIPPNAFVYLGNSLPIREWSLFANFNQQNFECSANRGANGIDGQISSFLGAAVASGRKENWAILGDLTFLYDCNSLLLIKRLALKDINIRIIVINNSGGRIFEALPYFKKLTPEASQKADFLNEHSISCSDVANGFGIASLRLESAKINSSLPSSVVIEIIPSEKESEIFRKSYALVSAERS